MTRTDTGRRRLVRAILVVVLLLLVVLSLVILYAITSRDATAPPTGSADPTTPAAGGSDLVVEQYLGLPPGAEPGDSGAVPVPDEGTIHVFTTGSSSCPEVPTDVAVEGDEVVVTVSADYSGPCTADFTPTTSVIEIPDAYRGTEPPVVRVERTTG